MNFVQVNLEEKEMNKQYCALCGKEVALDQKCTITVKGKRSGFDVEEKKELCLKCMMTILDVSGKQTEGTENE